MYSSMMRLPLELRLQIYEQLFEGTVCTLQIYQNKLHLLRSDSETPPLPLLLTSKTVSTEVSRALFNVTTFKVHLHVQHLPLIQQQRQLVPDGTAIHEFGTGEWAKHLPRFVSEIRRLELDVWVTDSKKAMELVGQIEALRDILGRQRELKSLVVRLKWRPRWFSSGCEMMTREQANGLLDAVLGVKCRRGRVVEVDEEMLDLMKS